jgi:acetolactate decarboxylase
LSLEGRLPFLVEGDFEELQWHVIDGRRLSGNETSHRDHLKAAVRHTSVRATGTLVGFYSPNDQGVFTHMGSKTHVHCVVGEPVGAGHVDHVDLPAGVTFKLPGKQP